VRKFFLLFKNKELQNVLSDKTVIVK